MGVLRRSWASVWPLGIAAALVFALTSCGGGGGEDRQAVSGSAAAGARVFAEAGCEGCHVMAAAGATGTLGPSLDEVKPGYDRVVEQVERGGGQMPSFGDRLSDEEIRNVAAYVVESTGAADDDQQPLAGAFEPDETELSDCGSDGKCYEQAFGNLAYYDGPRKALTEFERRIAARGTVESNCHRIAHSIGAGGLAHFKGRVGQAFAAGSAACWSGYYHGVLERAFRGVPDEKLGPAARRMCADRDLRAGPTFILYQCVHGLGHGLMIYTGYDLRHSLRICDRLNDEWDQVSCTGGVFMENISSSYGVRSRWLKDSDLIYPCNAVAERHKLYCYLMVTSRILERVGYDWERTAQLCRKSEQGWVETCFQSFGRDASGQSRQNATEILRLCAVAGNMEGECLYGASRDMASNYAGGREASGLCRRAPKQHRAYCFNGIGTIIGTLERTLEGRRAACSQIARTYLRFCIEGADA
jgi:mono/diheme cytochrome c family protein